MKDFRGDCKKKFWGGALTKSIWRIVHHDVTDDISVILVSGGNPRSSADTVGFSVELLYTNGSQICSLPDLPYLSQGHTQTGVTLCGGHRSPQRTTCHTLSSSGSWELSHNLTENRREHCAWDSPQGIILIGGDFSDTTTEILLENGETNPGFNLDYRTT